MTIFVWTFSPKFKIFNSMYFDQVHLDSLAFRVGVVRNSIKDTIKLHILFFH